MCDKFDLALTVASMHTASLVFPLAQPAMVYRSALWLLAHCCLIHSVKLYCG